MKIWRPYSVQKTDRMLPTAVSAENEFIYDENGNEYVDAISTWWTSIHGHGRKEIYMPVTEALQKLDHSVLASFANRPSELLTEKLNEFTKGIFKRVHYTDNGSCAVEAAVKIAVQHFQIKKQKTKKKFIRFSHSYHGDTVGAMSVSGSMVFTDTYSSLLFETEEIPSPDCFRCPLKKTPESCRTECMDRLEEYAEKNSETTAGLVIEPLIQGASGMKMYSEKVLRRIREITEKNDIIMIVDEVFTGFGRTGENFAYEKAGILPDMITVSKGLSGGFLPIAAVLVGERAFAPFYSEDRNAVLYHGHTMTGNPVTCTAALHSLILYERENRLSDVNRLESKFKDCIGKIENKFSYLECGRVKGAVCAFEVPEAVPILTLFDFCMKRGVFIRPLGNTVYVAPSYTVSDASLEKIFSVLSEFLKGLRV
ncbi:MAG TPA: adenosylmethionine--8-amino-7-oxononanoate transaminase [Leptospiraceae bacterium]|nr:adenosylmethionine--8-amino-7-oxononanoate transaminase [Leptospiraceae bacterium]HNI26909.1 adenosylmethionine--8-amino-7-oxononanoate transaminase [Leptospiraceae bacterium]